MKPILEDIWLSEVRGSKDLLDLPPPLPLSSVKHLLVPARLSPLHLSEREERHPNSFVFGLPSPK